VNQPPPGGFLVQGDLMLRLIGLLSFALLVVALFVANGGTEVVSGINDGGYW
jgi:hypothetical protein